MTHDDAPEVVKAGLATLESLKARVIAAARQALGTGVVTYYPVDILGIAAARRTVDLIDGFASQVRDRRPLCAIPLLRMQLDTAMRLFACSVVDNADAVLECLSEEKPFSKLKSRDGHPLTDAYLHGELAKTAPWVSDVYRTTSSFIHFSGPALLQAIPERRPDGQGGELITFDLGRRGREWTPSEQANVVDRFLDAVMLTEALLLAWKNFKRQHLSSGVVGGA